MLGTKKKYALNMTNVETLPTRKLNVKLLMVSLGLLFSNQRSGLVRTGGWEPLERGRKREGGKEKS